MRYKKAIGKRIKQGMIILISINVTSIAIAEKRINTWGADVIVIQEELKQTMIEMQLLKQKITELTDKFKLMDGARETYIMEL